MQKTTLAKKGELTRPWVLVDLKDKVLGRAATQIANLLRGKTSPRYTPHEDMGCFVVAVNAEKIRLTGHKWGQKLYRRHSGYPGGLKEVAAQDMVRRRPTYLVEAAVRGMLPKNRMQEVLMTKLKIFEGPAHTHAAQQPQNLELR